MEWMHADTKLMDIATDTDFGEVAIKFEFAEQRATYKLMLDCAEQPATRNWSLSVRNNQLHSLELK